MVEHIVRLHERIEWWNMKSVYIKLLSVWTFS